MRPEILFPLFAEITTLPGIGGRTAAHLGRLGIRTIADLLWHLPTSVVDRSYSPAVMEAPDGVIATLLVTVGKHDPAPRRGKRPYRVKCYDDSGPLDLVFFHPNTDYIRDMLPVGAERLVSGKVEHFQGQAQMSHPDYILPPSRRADLPKLEPVYALTAGLSGKMIRKAVMAALGKVPDLPEWLDPGHIASHGWPAWKTALERAHSPSSPADVSFDSFTRTRLAYDELLSNQLALVLVRARMRKRKGWSIRGDGRMQDKVRAALPFSLTGDQETVLAEIRHDMAEPAAMLRLVQGDVGSGKTIVALMAMLNAVETGAQAALLAPTEILARQHAATLAPLADAAGVRLQLLTGRDKGRARQRILEDLASGDIAILIGTHALIEKDVEFHDLALAVVDEQHRFGVHQRLKLTSKGRDVVDVLVMTATPIPRTLALTAYGDMDVSRIVEKPPGRKPIETRTISSDRLGDVVDGVGRAIDRGARVYWVCPLVEESEVSDLAAAEARHKVLAEAFGDRVGLVHGRMKGGEKDAVMADFAAGRISILVATTVIEVGVDVPEATVMIIEHAERFGLSQLHQLRGRVGRGGDKSNCLLVYSRPLGETARSRLAIMRETEDGFRIAEEDLRLRGAGELLGTRQSGMPEFRVADLAVHQDLLATARKDAVLVLTRDPRLEGERGRALRVLLYLFERDAAIRYLQSG